MRRAGPLEHELGARGEALRDAARVDEHGARVAPLAHVPEAGGGEDAGRAGAALAGQLERDAAAERVARGVCARQADLLEELADRARQRLDGRLRRQLVGVAEAREVDGDHLALARQTVEHRHPHLPLRADAVDEDERRAAAAAVVGERHVLRKPRGSR